MSSPAVVASAPPSSSSSSSSTLDAQLIAATRDGKGFDECKALIEKGARVNAKNSNRNTALHYAARYGQDNIAKLLLDHGAMPNVKNTNGWTPLHEAANNGHVKLAKLLLQQGRADCNSKGMGGYTPLHDAAIKGHVSMVHLLLDHGANLMAKNNEGKTVHDVASRGLTSMDLHLYKALQPTRSAIAKLTATCQQQQQELAAIKDHMARQRKADFDTLRRETHHVQQSMQQLLAQQAAKYEQQMQAQRNEFLIMLGRNNGGSISTTTRQQVEQQPGAIATPSVTNEYNASAKLPSPTSLEEKSLEKSPLPMATVSSTARSSTSGSAGSTVAAADTTAALALQRLVLQRNNDMTTLRREIQGTHESLAKLLRDQVEDRVKKAIITATKSQKQEAAGGDEVTKNALVLQEEIQSLRQEQERQAKVLQNITSSSSSSANTNVNNTLGNGSNDIEKVSSSSTGTSSSDLRQEVAALRDEFAANKENVQAEMSNLKKEILMAQKSSGNNAIAAARSRSVASSSTSDVVGGDDTTTTEDDNHLKQLQRKKSEKEEAAISAMRDAFMSKHQADLETLRSEIMAAEEHLMGLIHQQKTSPSLSSSNNNKSRSIPETASDQDQDESTCQGEEGDYVTHEELKKSLQKKTKKQEASLAELREEFTKLMEFLEHVDVGSLRDDMMELVHSQVEQQNAAVAELREAIATHQQPPQKSSPGLPPIQESKKKDDRDASSDDDEDDDDDEEDEDDDNDDEEEEDDGSLEELKKTIEIQAEAQHKALIALGDKLSLQRKHDLTALREENASTREQLENQMQQHAEQQETMIAALREEMSTGVVSPPEQGVILSGIRDEIKEMEESLKVLIQNQSKKQGVAIAALQKKIAMKEDESKSVATDEMSRKLIQKQQEEINAKQQADMSTLKKEIDATKASLKKLRDQQESNQTPSVHESRNVGTGGDDDNSAYENLERLVEEQEKEQRDAITKLQKDIIATNEKLNQLSAEHENKSVTASPSQTGRPKWSPRSLISPLSPKSRSSRDIVNAAQHEQGTSAPSDESLKLIQKEQQELKAQQQADIAYLQKEVNSTKELLRKLTDIHVRKPSSQASSQDSTTGDEDIKKLLEKHANLQRAELANLHKDIEATKERLEEIAEQQQQNGMAALEEKFIAKEKVNTIIQRSLIEQDSQREAQMKSILRTQEELDELIKSLEKHGGISSSEQKDSGDKEQEDQLRTDIADLRVMVSNYLLALKETMEEVAALREQVDAKEPGEDGESDASSKDSEMPDELDRMFDAQSEELPKEEDVTLQEELRKVTAELRMVQAVADRYKETVMKLHKISEQALT